MALIVIIVWVTISCYDFVIILGECWSGPEAGETYNKAGAGTECVTAGYKKCSLENDMECIGGKNTNFVYGIQTESK